ncbi:MAG TPA: hypothetical protein VFR02_09150, partial [bacterium]|nr:hypothetical protein [bacterium]
MGLALAGGCSPRLVARPEPAAVPPPRAVAPEARPVPTALPTPPPLTKAQLLGFQAPPDLGTDPPTGKKAQAAVIDAYEQLKALAAQDGWRLILVSGYRSYWHQVSVW